MPDFTTIDCEVACTNCGNILTKAVDIQWGKVPLRYNVGEQIKWLYANGCLVPPFVLIEGFEKWNCGGPDIENLIAFDCNLFALDNEDIRECTKCQIIVSGIRVDIRKGRIVKVTPCSSREVDDILGEYRGAADIVVVEEEKYLTPRPDLYDARIQYINIEDLP